MIEGQRADVRSRLVSVVIAVHNGADLVGRAIESVIGQTHQNLEVIVVDDGSTDPTPSIVASFDDPRLVMLRGPNEGLPKARNKGIDRARGDFIAFLDHDDYWLAEKIRAQVTVLANQPDVVIVSCLLRQESKAGRVVAVTGSPIRPPHQKAIARGLLFPFEVSSLVIRRSALEAIGRFDEALHSGADLDLVARLAATGRIYCVNRILGAYTLDASSMTVRRFGRLRNEARFVQARLAARAVGKDLLREDFERANRVSLRERRNDLVQLWFRKAGVGLADRRWGAAVGFGLLALLGRPLDTPRRILLKRVGRRL